MTSIRFNKYGLFLQLGLAIIGVFSLFIFMAWDIPKLGNISMYLLGIAFGMALVVLLDKRITTSYSKQKTEEEK
jgi:hypothetical protein